MYKRQFCGNLNFCLLLLLFVFFYQNFISLPSKTDFISITPNKLNTTPTTNPYGLFNAKFFLYQINQNKLLLNEPNEIHFYT